MHITPNNKKYIGLTSMKPSQRYGKDGNGYKRCKLFYRAIQKYGWDNIQHIILFEGLTKEEACKKEQELIAKYQSNNTKFGYNRSLGGESGSYGIKLTDEQRRKISERLKGHLTSDETRQKIGKANSVALKGKHLTDETKKKLSIAHKGKKVVHTAEQDKLQSDRMKGTKLHLGYKASEESRKRMSEAHIGLPLTQKQLDNLAKIHKNNKGKPRSPEVREKIRKAHLGKKRGPWTEEQRKAHMDAYEKRRQLREQSKNI